MTDKKNGGGVASGHADAILPVEFKAEATCTCGYPSLTYTWYFGDEKSAIGATVSHTYGSNGAGSRSPRLNVVCGSCAAEADPPALSCEVISDIKVTKIGDIDNPTTNGRLCFDAVPDVEAVALPEGVGGSNLIDWHLVIGAEEVELPNKQTGDLPSPSPWPLCNSSWGSVTLYVSIDGPHVDGQQGELKLTGINSYVWNNKGIKIFYDLLGSLNPGTGSPKPKNWFYYWTQTSAMCEGATLNYGTSNHCYPTDHPDYPAYLGDSVTTPFGTPDVGKNKNKTLTYIDHFAWTSRHEWKHHESWDSWWGASGVDPARDTGDDDCIPDSDPDVESSFGADEGGPYDTTKDDSHPGDSLDVDSERHTCFTQDDWTIDSADGEDWAHPGSQWPSP